MTRKYFCAGNWKMNTLKKNVEEILTNLKNNVDGENADIVVAPPAAYLQMVQSQKPSYVQLAAQNCFKKSTGAFTGEISPTMLLDFGTKWVILGHSERRHVFGETDELISEKVSHALKEGLHVIACIGETKEQRQSNQTAKVVQEQLKSIASGVTDWTKVVIAYEPVWAIGTGIVATPDQAQEAHKLIRSWIADNVSSNVADHVRVVYGGSVNAANCKALSKLNDVDGFLVGGASLTAEFATICNATKA
ncbi:triosephosphate isomerase-like [Cimex lectularius]|uniref:Triosephosphate isomerase n=1 Tax=Cimex lectularius TaxID=79782 RepID=A0A8I6S3F1_CIMLE|nr:triosephosphate isomerase-like [Cimex lectularius]